VAEPPAGLADQLRAWQSHPAVHRAVELVIAGGWVDRPEFVRRCVVAAADDGSLAVIDWAEVAASAAGLDRDGRPGGRELWTIHGEAARSWGGGAGARSGSREGHPR
jgi:hypothetical protein